MRRRRNRAGFLAGKMVEEGALGEPSLSADVLDARRRIALRADDVDGGIEQFLNRRPGCGCFRARRRSDRAGFGYTFHHGEEIPTSRYLCQAKSHEATAD